MLANYLKIAWRTLRRQATYTAINSIGLALGFAVALLAILFVWDEWSHDAFHTNGDRLYRVVGTYPASDGPGQSARTDGPLAPLLTQHLPVVERAVRISKRSLRVKPGGVWADRTALFADPAFLDAFTFPLAQGDPATALQQPGGVVLSAAMARQLFDAPNPVGRSLPVEFHDGARTLTVTGVLVPIPRTSSLQFDLLLPLETLRYTRPAMLREQTLQRWRMRDVETYVQLLRDTSPDTAAAQIASVVEAHGGEIPMGFTNAPKLTGYRLQPVSDIYLSPDLQDAYTERSNPVYSYVLLGIAALVILLACANFAILAVGRSAGRAQEVGVRKALGARRGQLQQQFLGEACLTMLLALGAGLLLARLLLPAFNALAGRMLSFTAFSAPTLIMTVVGLALGVAVVAGGYPAWLLARFDPASVFRGWSGGASKHGLVRGLVVLQFALSIALLAGAFVMEQQLRYVQQTDLGFDTERVLVVENSSSLDPAQLIGRLRSTLTPSPSVQQVSGMSRAYGEPGTRFRTTRGDSVDVPVYWQTVEARFTDLLDIDLVAGRQLPKAQNSEAGQSRIVINRALAEAMNALPEDMLGSAVQLRAGNMMLAPMEVVGVVENYHFRSLHHAVEPLVLSPTSGVMGGRLKRLLVRTAPGRTAEALNAIQAAWSEVAPDEPFRYRFMDDAVQAQYEADQRWATIVRYAVGIALLIACFGLFGLSALAAERRTREIGIRKALGATARQIVVLLSKEFALLVGIALAAAVPLSYWAAQRWLQDFAHRIEPGAGVFLGAGALAFVIALATVSAQALRAARIDPAEALRSE